jgi:hypothetical protein
MIRLVTVTGSRTNTLWHMLNHYKNIVDEMCIVVYEWEGFSTFDEVSKIVKQFSNAKIVNRVIKEKFNWEYVTQLYNETKLSHPNDWWIVSDDDEFHVYSKPVEQIILDCERNGWKLVRGGFVDRVGVGGTFPKITKGEDIFKQFPLAGFFRYQMSGACPNKVCIMKGDIEITPGQHYAKIDDQTTWKWQGWNHPLIAPIEEYSVQVHHFKWDSTCIERIKSVADIRQSYSFSDEYRKMYQSLRSNNFEVEIENEDYMFESDLIYPDFENYSQWSKLIKKIISI